MRWHTQTLLHAVHPASLSLAWPTLGHTVPSGPNWVHEIKHDGYRFICRREGERARVYSRRGHDWNDRVSLIAEAIAGLRVFFGT